MDDNTEIDMDIEDNEEKMSDEGAACKPIEIQTTDTHYIERLTSDEEENNGDVTFTNDYIEKMSDEEPIGIQSIDTDYLLEIGNTVDIDEWDNESTSFEPFEDSGSEYDPTESLKNHRQSGSSGEDENNDDVIIDDNEETDSGFDTNVLIKDPDFGHLYVNLLTEATCIICHNFI